MHSNLFTLSDKKLEGNVFRQASHRQSITLRTAHAAGYQAVVVRERLGDEDVCELLHQDPLAIQELQVWHGEPLQVVGSETVE